MVVSILTTPGSFQGKQSQQSRNYPSYCFKIKLGSLLHTWQLLLSLLIHTHNSPRTNSAYQNQTAGFKDKTVGLWEHNIQNWKLLGLWSPFSYSSLYPPVITFWFILHHDKAWKRNRWKFILNHHSKRLSLRFRFWVKFKIPVPPSVTHCH